MSFRIQGKVAIVTGAGSGMGFEYVVELLNRGAKAVTLVDICPQAGNQAVENLKKQFDHKRVLFAKADISNYEEFEGVFQRTLTTFKNIDILINNAGVLDDANWQRMVKINVNGTANGLILAVDHYLPKHKSGDEAVVLNVSSVAGIAPFGGAPIYSGTKFAIHGMTLSWGTPSHYHRTKVRVICLAPGGTLTPLCAEIPTRLLAPDYLEIMGLEEQTDDLQEAHLVAEHAMGIIEGAPGGSLWVVENGQPPYRYQLPDRFWIPKPDAGTLLSAKL